MENRFNLIEEKWIPVTERGRVSLMDVFSDDSISGLSGNPVEKIALFKLLLAIAQSAVTQKDEEEWENLGTEGMKEKVLSYLEKHKDCFWLYGEKPFLQMKVLVQLKELKKKSFGLLQMEISTGNNVLITDIQKEKELTDAEKAVLLVMIMGFACGGKKFDKPPVVLTKGYTEKSDSAKPGTCLGKNGLNHSFFKLNSLVSTIYLNLYTNEQIRNMKIYENGIGVAPWEKMPNGEDDEIARALKKSYMGRLIPLNRFVLFDKNELYCMEGLIFETDANNSYDPSMTIKMEKDKVYLVQNKVDKKPWREIASLLSFLDVRKASNNTCLQLRIIAESRRLMKYDKFSLWTGGAEIDFLSGEQTFKQKNDFVESEVEFSSDFFMDTENFYGNLNLAMEYMDNLSKNLFGSVNAYFKKLTTPKEKTSPNVKKENNSPHASNATSDYWQLCEGQFQKVIDACSDSSGARLKSMHKIFNGFVYQLYDQYCPKDTARQLEAWAENKPRIKKDKEE